MDIIARTWPDKLWRSIRSFDMPLNDAAKAIGLDRANLSRAVHGAHATPNLRMLIRWAVYAKVPLSDVGLEISDDLAPTQSLDPMARAALLSNWSLLAPDYSTIALKRTIAKLGLAMPAVNAKLGYAGNSTQKMVNPQHKRKITEIYALRFAKAYSIPVWNVGLNLYQERDAGEAVRFFNSVKAEHRELIESNQIYW